MPWIHQITSSVRIYGISLLTIFGTYELADLPLELLLSHDFMLHKHVGLDVLYVWIPFDFHGLKRLV